MPVKVAVVGATGNVGRELVRLLEDSPIVLGEPVVLASSLSADDAIIFRDTQIEVQQLDGFDFKGITVAFFATPKEIGEKYIPAAQLAGARVIDMSASQASAPIVVPEVNGAVLPKDAQLVQTPHAFAIQLSMVINALQKKSSVKNVVSTALLAASGAGKNAMDELFAQSAGLLGGAGAESMEAVEFGHQAAFNCIPQVGQFEEGATSTNVEMSTFAQTNQVLGSQIPMTVTGVYVPTFVGASQSVAIEFNGPLSAEEARVILEKADGITVIDAPEKGEYSTPFGAAETDQVFVSRIRKDLMNPNVLHMWIVTDNLRKGSALNALQIAELLVN